MINEIIKYKAICGEESDLFISEESAKKWFDLCDDFCKGEHKIIQVIAQRVCSECKCITSNLDDDFNEIDEVAHHLEGCKLLK